MSSPSESVTPELLREWGLPDPGDSKKTRGEVIVVGGSRRAPGAALLAGEAALRVGAGRLGLLVPSSIQGSLGPRMPEAAVFTLPEGAGDPIDEAVAGQLRAADVVLFGPGFDDPDATRATLVSVAQTPVRRLVLDAFALGILPDVDRDLLPEDLILNPNQEEAAILLGRDLSEDRIADLHEIARRFAAVVNCYGDVVSPRGESWHIEGGGAGLGTSGSGDVLAGGIAGFAARGLDSSRAAVWGSWAHARAGDLLTERVGIGFLARDIPSEMTVAIAHALGGEQ